MDKSRDAFRTISEVADWLGTPTHVLRFWESRFTQVKPVKRAGGRRYYRPADMELLGGIKQLLHDDGMTIRGVQKLLREEGVRHVAALSQPIDEGIAGAVEPASGPVDEAPMAVDVPQVAEPQIDNVVSMTPTGSAPMDEPAEAPADTTTEDAHTLPVQGDFLEESGLTPAQPGAATTTQDTISEVTPAEIEAEAEAEPLDAAMELPEGEAEVALEDTTEPQDAQPSFGDHTPDFIQTPDSVEEIAPTQSEPSVEPTSEMAAPEPMASLTEHAPVVDAPAVTTPMEEPEAAAEVDETPSEWELAPEPLTEPSIAPASEAAPLDEAPIQSPQSDVAPDAAADIPGETIVAQLETQDDLAQMSDFEDVAALDEAGIEADALHDAPQDATPALDPAPVAAPEGDIQAEQAPEHAQTTEIKVDIPADPSDEDDLPDANFAALSTLRAQKDGQADQEALSGIFTRLSQLRDRM